MTRKRYMNAKCPVCNVDGVCPECGGKIPQSTPFSDWLRTLEIEPLTSGFISNHNLDYIWHNYKENWFITIEEKRYCGKPSFAQRDTHGIVEQLLKNSSGDDVTNQRGQIVKIEYRGHYYVSFEKTTPDDSSFVLVNSDRYSDAKNTILYLLRYGKFNGPCAPAMVRANGAQVGDGV